jgi:hypothetical protein
MFAIRPLKETRRRELQTCPRRSNPEVATSCAQSNRVLAALKRSGDLDIAEGPKAACRRRLYMRVRRGSSVAENRQAEVAVRRTQRPSAHCVPQRTQGLDLPPCSHAFLSHLSSHQVLCEHSNSDIRLVSHIRAQLGDRFPLSWLCLVQDTLATSCI